jgi:hypothetical protein
MNASDPVEEPVARADHGLRPSLDLRGAFGSPLPGPLHDLPGEVGFIEAAEMIDRALLVLDDAGVAVSSRERTLLEELSRNDGRLAAVVASMLTRAVDWKRWA